MALLRRPVFVFLSALAVLGLWHLAIAGRVSPDPWSRGGYAGAEKALSGWSAGVCKTTGVCGSWLGRIGGGQPEVKANKKPRKAPAFVYEHAPYVYLHSEEKFMPCDIGEHLLHTTPFLNYTPVASPAGHATLWNLDEYNKFGDHVYLTSDDDPSNPPSWLRGDRNVPSGAPGSKDDIGLSTAPGIIIWTEKEGGIVDAFYFYFYSFNLGNTVAGWRFGNHVGDWEHTVVRFVDGQPVSMFFSEHSGGAAYEYAVVEKIGKRPVTYSARGSHANYATPGAHYYAVPFHLLADHTNKGHLWDPVKNNYMYHYDISTSALTPDIDNARAPVAWFHYGGRWGDRFYPMDDRRQYRVAGYLAYVNGPTGPKTKNLDRVEICQNEGICVIQPSLTYRLEGVKGPALGGDDERYEEMIRGDQGDVEVEFGGRANEADVEEADFERLRVGRDI